MASWREIKRLTALQREGEARGGDTRKAREEDLRGRTPEHVLQRREQSAQSASVCADCLAPLAPGASATMVNRRVLIPARYHPVVGLVREHDKWLRVPICVTCWLVDLQSSTGRRIDPHEHQALLVENVRRQRCLGCGRPLRLYRDRALYLVSHQVCCCDCLHRRRNDRNNARRRVHHQKIRCPVCRKMFMPKRSDARTCSNTCRQQLFRKRRAD
jgi:hypothetical protein